MFWNKEFFFNFSKFFIVIVIWANCSELFREKKQDGLSKQNYKCPEDLFSCIKFEISSNVLISCTYSEKHCAKNFWQTCQNCTCVVQKKILRKNSCFEIFVSFLSGFLSHSALPYGRRNFANLSKHQLTCPKEHFSR